MGFFKRASMMPDAQVASVRAETYEALAELMDSSSTPTAQAIGVVGAAPCGWVGSTPLRSPDLAEAAGLACDALAHDSGVDTLLEERRALFGGDGQAQPRVPTCESVYLSRDAHADRIQLEALYAEAGYYVTPGAHEKGTCAGHIATQLSFMAHVLRREAERGRAARAGLADSFCAQHLAQWADAFAHQVLEHAEHDTLRFSATALQSFIDCERALLKKRGRAVVLA